jgi:hypothetical protein
MGEQYQAYLELSEKFRDTYSITTAYTPFRQITR